MKKETAMKILKKLHDSALFSERTALETLIPELKENEDERIRKAIKHQIERLDNEGWSGLDGVEYSKMISWLEKQGEQKRLGYPYVPGWRENRPDNKPQIKRSVLMLTTHGVVEGEWYGDRWYQYRWNCDVKDTDVLYWLHLSDLESLEKEGNSNSIFSEEQKPAWSEDERTRKNCIHFLELQKEHHAATFEIEECINWLKSLKDRVVPQDEQIKNDNETNQQKGGEK